MEYLYIALLVLLGILMVAKPELLWKLEHFLTVKNGEPSDLYIAVMRVSGAFLIILCIFLLLFSIA